MLLSVLMEAGPHPRRPPRSGDRPGRAAGAVPDEALVARARAGEERALGELYRRHVRYVLGMAVRMLGHWSDGEDVTQEVFAVAVERLSTLREPAAFRGWVAQIAVNLVRKRLRHRRLLALLGLDAGSADATLEILADASGHAEARAELVLLDAALARLSPEDRIAWMLRFVEGEDVETVATLCGCSLSTAKRRIGRAAELVSAHVRVDEPSRAAEEAP